MKWLTLQHLEILHMQIVDSSGGSQGVRDRNRLESALAAMKQIVHGQELYPTIFDKAAILARGIIADHPFIDGNKRTGIMSALVFLNLNNVSTEPIKDQDLEDFAVKIAAEKLEVLAIAQWLQTNCQAA